MSIKREDLDAGRIEFADVTTGKRVPLIHPGQSLRLNGIVPGRRGITADTAFRLARYFSTTPDFWINLQARYDLDAAERKLRRRIEREVRPRAA